MWILGIFIGPFKNFDDFRGRAPRLDCWIFLLVFLFFWSIAALTSLLLPAAEIVEDTLVLLAVFPGASLAVRRFHDTGRSGWFALTLLVPIVCLVGLGILLFARSEPEENRYGPVPAEAGYPPDPPGA